MIYKIMGVFFGSMALTAALIGIAVINSQTVLAESLTTEMVTATTTPTITRTFQPTNTPTPLPTANVTQMPLQTVDTAVGLFGLPGSVECWNCSPFHVTVKLSHYLPFEGGDNCFEYNQDLEYCTSETASLIPWESVYGFGAACPREWPIGTWVVIPKVGAFVCFDRGGMINCDNQGICNVDILGPGDWWDQMTFDNAVLWVPFSPRK